MRRSILSATLVLNLRKSGESVASAAQQLLDFADVAQAMLEAEAAGNPQQLLDLPEHLGRCAANLWDRFVEAAQINGGVPGVEPKVQRFKGCEVPYHHILPC